MEMTKQDIEKLFAELHRIGNAVEILAMHADDRFVPLDEALRVYRRELNQRKAETRKSSGLPEGSKP